MVFWTTKRTTPGQWKILIWVAIIFFVLVGGIGLYLSSQPHADKLNAVLDLRFLSFCSWGVAAVIYVAKCVIAYLID
jgi:hypothetical protein